MTDKICNMLNPLVAICVGGVAFVLNALSLQQWHTIVSMIFLLFSIASSIYYMIIKWPTFKKNVKRIFYKNKNNGS